MASVQIAEIAPLRALPFSRDRFDYRSTDQTLRRGDLVRIIFRKRREYGIVLRLKAVTAIPPDRLSDVDQRIPGRGITNQQLDLAEWMAREYLTSLGQVLKSFVVPGARPVGEADVPPLPQLHAKKKRPARQFSFVEYRTLIDRDRYLDQSIRSHLQSRRPIIVLFPERAGLERFASRLPRDFARRSVIIHGSLARRDRETARGRLSSGSAELVLGTISALFEPIPKEYDLFIDDEPNQNYKQVDRQPHYHVRDLAGYLSRRDGAAATFLGVVPSLELAYHLRRTGGRWLRLIRRQSAATLELAPRTQNQGRPNPLIVGYALEQAIQDVLKRHGRVLLYQNRLGQAQLVACSDCGWQPSCPACRRPLSVRANAWLCRFCGYQTTSEAACPSCQGTSLRLKGFGTGRVAEWARAAFPSAVVAIVDSDHARADHLDRADILVGTSAVFRRTLPPIQLIGVISLEALLARTEWWAREQTVYTIWKLAGLQPSVERVISQTDRPNDRSGRLLVGSVREFLRAELADRVAFGFPPTVELVKLSRASASQADAAQAAKLAARLKILSEVFPELITVSPPFRSEPGRGRERVGLLLRLRARTSPARRAKIFAELPDDWFIDVHPLSLD